MSECKVCGKGVPIGCVSCSSECKRLHFWEEVKCTRCDKAFEKRKMQTREYCSKSCFLKHKIERAVKHECRCCGHEVGYKSIECNREECRAWRKAISAAIHRFKRYPRSKWDARIMSSMQKLYGRFSHVRQVPKRTLDSWFESARWAQHNLTRKLARDDRDQWERKCDSVLTNMRKRTYRVEAS